MADVFGLDIKETGQICIDSPTWSCKKASILGITSLCVLSMHKSSRSRRNWVPIALECLRVT